MPHASDKAGLGDVRQEVRSITEVKRLIRRLSQVQYSLTKVKRVVEEKEIYMCWLESHEEGLKSIDTVEKGFKNGMLAF